MEAMDIFLATTKDVSYLVFHHPIYSALGSVLLFFTMLRFYCRLTLGICECDQDMTGKTVLVTGASAGIGKATAMDMAKRNARVILACRNVGKANRVAQEIKSSTGNQNVVVKCLDLSSFESVRRCTKDVLDTEEKLDVLINNAGVSGVIKITEDGYDEVFQSNHLGHFLFTLLLIDLLKKSAPCRIINVSSYAYTLAKLESLEDFKNDKSLAPLQVYANTKLANILFSNELAKRLSNTGITVNSLHPGCVKTDILNNVTSVFTILTKILFIFVGKSCEEGAQTSIYLAVHPDVQNATGKFYMDCKEEHLKEKLVTEEAAKRLFEASERVVGETFS